MTYRITIEVGYCEALFDFDDVNEAAEFAKTALKHQSENNGTKKTKINLEIISEESEEE